MIDYPVFIGLWTVVFVVMVLNRSKKFNDAQRIFIDEGSVVYCRDLPLARIFNLKGKALIKADVVKVQRAKRCVTLFTSSGNAVDLFLPKNTVEEVDKKAQSLFPNAAYVEV